MYKAAVRFLIRRNIRALNAGNYQPALAMFDDNAVLSFPGDNSFAHQHRLLAPGRHVSATHRGKSEIESFLKRYVDNHIQMEVEDILVNGPPWNLRAGARVHVWIEGPDGSDIYTNRAMIVVRTVWGKIRSQEDYEDTERAAALDRRLAGAWAHDRPDVPHR